VLSEVLRAGRESTAGLSPLSTPDSILMCYQKSRRGRDEEWHSAQVRARHTGLSAYVWRDYAMIRRLARRCRFR